MKARFKKIAIIGVGLIGGSIGLAVRRKGLAGEVVGICRRKSSMRSALRMKVLDSATMSYREGLKNADFIIIATPVGRIIDIAKRVAEYSDTAAILTDVGSTKGCIVHKLEKITAKKLYYVGSHPMAGSEKSGVAAADSALFNNSKCILAKTRSTNLAAMKKVKKFWEAIGAKCFVLSPEEHDRYIACVSHLPHIAASGITLAALPESIAYASTGFGDTTRIAASDPKLWQDIFVSNKKAVLKSLQEYKRVLATMEKSIRNENLKLLGKLLLKSRNIREGFEKGYHNCSNKHSCHPRTRSGVNSSGDLDEKIFRFPRSRE